MTHELKILPMYFQAVWDGKKTFEVRKNDRGYKLNDILILKEWDGTKYTGSAVEWLKRIPLIDLSNGRGLCRVIMEDDFKKAIKKMPKGIIVDVAPTVDAVPVSELEKLRDYLYAEDLIFMRGLAELNKLIANYGAKMDKKE